MAEIMKSNDAIDPQKADEIAERIIKNVHTHDEFFRAMKVEGVNLTRDGDFNNFPKRLSAQYGYALEMLASFAEFRGLTKNLLEGGTTNFHDEIGKLLGKTEELKTQSVPSSSIDSAKQELNMRLLLSKHTFSKQYAPYCTIGNPELQKKYYEKDTDARNFVFECAKILLLQGKKFYEDIYR